MSYETGVNEKHYPPTVGVLPANKNERGNIMPLYDVEYAVNRSETYRVEAKTRAEAERTAFECGETVGAGETNNYEVIAVRKVKL